MPKETQEGKVNIDRKTTFFTMLNTAMLAALLIVYTLGISTLASQILCIGVLVSQIFSCIYTWKFNDASSKPIDGVPQNWYKTLNRTINKVSILITLLAAISLVAIAFFDLSLLQYGLVALVGAQTITLITSFIVFCYKKILVDNANLTNKDLVNFSKRIKLLNNLFYNTLAQSITCLLLGLTIALKFFTPIGFLTPEVTAIIVGACSAILLSCQTMLYFIFPHSANREQAHQDESPTDSHASTLEEGDGSDHKYQLYKNEEIDAALSAALSASLGTNPPPSTIVSSSENSETTDSSLRPGTHKG